MIFKGTFLNHSAFARSVRMQRSWRKQYGKKQKTIQQYHMISSKNTRAIPVMQIELVTDVENALRQKYFQDGMKLLLQKAVQKDHQAVMRIPRKLLIRNVQERMEK